MNWATFWAAFTGALIGCGLAGVVAVLRMQVLRRRRVLADLRRTSDYYRVPAPRWRFWNREADEWNPWQRRPGEDRR